MSISQNFGNVSPSLLLDFANTKTLDRRITFTRSTPACHYDGRTTAMAEQNLLTYSQAFDNAAWSKYVASITADTTTAPDGTTTADTFTPTGTNPLVYQLSPSAGTFTFSVYAKALVDTNVTLACTTGFTGVAVQFNLSAGTAGSVTSYSGGANATITGGTASIVSVGNGWYRCILAGVTVTQARAFHFGSGGTNGTSTGTIYAWGAQLEQRSSATAYTATTTQPITNYIPVLLTAGGNQPRFDCNPTTGESLGLLIEEQRTNIALYSSDFSNAAWVFDGGTKGLNTAIAPDGTQTADQYIENTSGSANHEIYQSVSITSGNAYTFSGYFKSNGRNIAIIAYATSSLYTVNVNLSNGSIISTSGTGSNTITSVGNGWYRITATVTATATGTGYWDARPLNGSNTYNYTGDGYSGVFVWGAQLEAGAFATSYIATTSASATRTADYAVMTGTNFSSWYNQGQGTIYAEGQINYNPIGGGGSSFYSIDDTSASTNVIQPYFSNGSGILFSFVNVNGVEQSNTGVTAISAFTFFKHAQIYQTNNFASVVNNSTVSTDTSGITPVVTQLQFSNGKSKYFRKFAYYPLVVTTTQLQALTS